MKCRVEGDVSVEACTQCRACDEPSAASAGSTPSDTDLLNWLEQHTGCEVSCEGEEEIKWLVHRVTGGRNDRVWELIGGGATIREAIIEAMA